MGSDSAVQGLNTPPVRLTVGTGRADKLDDLADGIAHRLKMPSPAVRAAPIGDVLELCVLDKLADDVPEFFAGARDDPARQAVMTEALASNSHPDHRTGFSCTGFSLPGALTADGRHLHARNLDADLYNWNIASTVFLIDETAGNANWQKYVAFGTAGLIYSGGISGLNDSGIATSLHQLSTTLCRTRFAAGGPTWPRSCSNASCARRVRWKRRSRLPSQPRHSPPGSSSVPTPPRAGRGRSNSTATRSGSAPWSRASRAGPGAGRGH